MGNKTATHEAGVPRASIPRGAAAQLSTKALVSSTLGWSLTTPGTSPGGSPMASTPHLPPFWSLQPRRVVCEGLGAPSLQPPGLEAGGMQGSRGGLWDPGAPRPERLEMGKSHSTETETIKGAEETHKEV